MPAHSKNPNPYIVHCKSRQDVLCCETDESCCRHVTNVPSVSLFAQWCAAHPVTSLLACRRNSGLPTALVRRGGNVDSGSWLRNVMGSPFSRSSPTYGAPSREPTHTQSNLHRSCCLGAVLVRPTVYKCNQRKRV